LDESPRLQQARFEKSSNMFNKNSILLISMLAALLFWIVDALFQWGLLGQRSLAQELIFGITTHTLYLRLLVSTVFIIGGLLISRLVSRQQSIEKHIVFQSELLDHIGDSIVVTDTAGRIAYANDAACRALGKPRDALVGRGASEMGAGPGYVAAQQQVIARTLREGGWSGRVTHLTPDGRRMILHCRTWVIRDSAGEPQMMCSVSTDITELAQVEAEIRRERDRAQQYLDLVGVIMVALDREGRVTLINRLGCEVLGLPAEEVLGQSWFDRFLPERVRHDVRNVFKELMDGEAELVEFAENAILNGAGEERTIEWHNTLLRDEQGHTVGTLSSGTDVTERRREEAERRQLERQIQDIQKLESLSVLAGGVAHDFNNLLMSLLGHASLAVTALPPESRARHHIEQIETAALRAAELTQQMLAYSGRGKFVIETLNLSTLVEEMANLLQSVTSKDAELRFEFQPDLPPVEVDATQMRQVVMNLITNASDALDGKKGVLTIQTGVTNASAEDLAATYLNDDLAPGRYVVLEVSDTGHGMDAGTLSKIFDPFFTTKQTGRGLGLAAVIGIVRGHAGAIAVHSEPGRGTTFRILLPCSEKTCQATRQPEPRSPGAKRQGAILVVDDEDGCRKVTAHMLQAAGFHTLTARDGCEAVEVFEQHQSEIQLVILDLVMPKMGGEETFRELRRRDPKVRVLLTSGYNHQEATEELAKLGLTGFIQKPYRPPDLLARIDAILSGQTEETHGEPRDGIDNPPGT
jgi:two-component system, cell cycle sensor histidine kinase and response regulator CckA